jgi:HSP20 family protein
MARNPLSPYRSGGMMERGFGGDPFMSLHREMNRLFDDVFRGSFGGQSGGSQGGGAMVPHMDVSETDKEVRICAELPGVSEKDVDVTLDNDVLTIRGEKRFEREDEKENYHVSERSFGTFQRMLRLPFSVDPGQVKANFENGVLTVTLPKGKEQQRTRRIEVQGSGSGAALAGQSGAGKEQSESSKEQSGTSKGKQG